MGVKVAIYRNRRGLLLLFIVATAVYLLFGSRVPDSSLANIGTGAHEKWHQSTQSTVQENDADGERAKSAGMRFLWSSMRTDRVVVFSKSTCPFCKATKDLLEKYGRESGLRYKVIEVDLHTDAQLIRRALVSAYKRTTFPSIFIDSECLGGNDDIQQLEKKGALAKLLEDKGLIAAPASVSRIPAAKEEAPSEEPQTSAVDVRIRGLVKNNRVMVFSKTYCPYSKRAKALLGEYRSERGLEFVVLEADLEPDSMAVKQALGRISSRLTFPNIFVDGQSIGGSDELVQRHQSGELAAMLKERGLIV
ncbi:hypothetical protein GGI11_002776 [Coemansia sp. RSA 2049]|nr:hypothetical protein H4217_008501 [Coemansia sp. RSA 1939]KAJ2518765.1 hypothetical protein GGI11_002776 [Coemansia sp. RSA 2049]